MAKACKILIGTILLLCGCSTQYNEVAPDTELIIHVLNSAAAPLDGAIIYAFSDTSSFRQSISTGIPAGYDVTGKSITGVAHLTGLHPDVLYSIYVTYQDNSIFPGTYVTLDNSSEKYVLKNKLVRGSVSTLNISLLPADGFITFWTQSTNANAFPINLFLGSDAGGSLNQSASSPPTPFQPQGVTVRARKGTVPIQGKSAAGCLWTDQVMITPAQNLTYLISDCVVGTIAFYTDNTNTAKLPITLRLNANDVIPNLTTASVIPPADCSAINVSMAYRIPGLYTWEAISPGGNCVWTGTFTLTANSCNLIFLSTCN